MRTGILATSRPAPGRWLPGLGAALVLLIALPVFILAGWRISGWALGAVLWLAMQALNLLVARAHGRAGTLAAASVQGFALFFKAIGLLVVLISVAVTDAHLAVAAALSFALAYSFELGLSLVSYFGGAP
jgi:hypothetical protein